MVIGGIFTQDERTRRQQGAAARRHARSSARCSRNTTRTTSKTELLVFLTPRIITDRATVR
ncbi:MAG: hypothetical protein MZW92_63365 [Comamonadaceae bacterium]|nr:hypothetical protein [Comamonadaceae bacterium]